MKQEFIFSSKKPERAGKKGEYHVFLIDATHLRIAPTAELAEASWIPAEEVPSMLTFEDLKPIFQESLKYLQ